MMRKLLILLISICLMGAATISYSQQSGQRGRANTNAPHNQMIDEDWFYQGWTTEPLNGDNKPFHDIRMGLRQLGKRNSLKAKLTQFSREAQANPSDPKLQYRWVMCAYMLYDRNAENQPGKRVESSLWKWRNALSFAVQPKAYDYTRLRFLITTENAMTMGKYGSDERLKSLGKRLLKIQSKDEFVFYWQRQLLSRSSSSQDKLDNLHYAQMSVKSKPKDANAQGELAGSYRDLWMVTKRRSHANTAVAQYQKWLQMASKNDPFRSNATHWVKSIPKTQLLWEQQGTGRTD